MHYFLSKIIYVIAVSFSLISGFLFSPPTVFAAGGAKLWVDPSNKVVTLGDRVQVNIMLDTLDNGTDGVDIHFLKYNPQYLRVEDTDFTTQGIQIKPGILYPTTKTNTVDSVKGLIDFSQITTGGTTFKGRGILATVTFTVIGSNSSDVMFNFVPGVTTDTNVASKGKDILATAVGSRLAFAFTKPITPPSEVILTPPPPVFLQPQGQALVRNLWRGIRHEDVKILQQFLIGKGYLSSDSVTGFFGVLTEAAVKRFQCDQKIICDGDAVSTGYGVVGPRTKKVINDLMSSGTSMSREQIIEQLKRQIQELQQKIQELLKKR